MDMRTRSLAGRSPATPPRREEATLTVRTRSTEEGIAAYVAEIPAEHRPLFDRIHRLILESCPDVEVGIAYKCRATWLGVVVFTSASGCIEFRSTAGRQAEMVGSRVAIQSFERAQERSESRVIGHMRSLTTNFAS